MAFTNQPDRGEMRGFDFARDPLNSRYPMQPADEIMEADITAKPEVMAAQHRLLESRYDLTLDRSKATESEIRGEEVFFGKGQCAVCHVPPTYMDQQRAAPRHIPSSGPDP